MTRIEMDAYEAMLVARGPRLTGEPDGSVEILVDGEHVEIDGVPVIQDPCGEQYCDCDGSHEELDRDALAAFPEILAEIIRGGEISTELWAMDRAVRRAESGYAQ